ncbi:acetyl-CoA carboxylase, biotin carboxylase subunit [Roseovarius pacificus]|uniref:biotin carboxylase n=1 Tax=Roseovarius pacificus TaxID=337701 RepID=A0A1M7AAN3_9RHOB|nr:acetyl-CoA carboxylase biotin carboxylase subunit [Roseovarius pacificus]GGO53694.1 acetyl-CoA carboxylase biotin carboxylase subunit [Roseovarius pacificus]SHL39659.1 acetyl-CoA carboxylase, biotin carboxylase subunit [Roseovarius pacificus]
MTPTIRTLLIANRGEIAVRIIRAARDLGLRTVQIVSAADHDMLAARLADEVIEIGPAPANQSYLNIERILTAAKESGADAIHPGYGFLSENAEFARRTKEMGLVFCGPDADTIERMGDKVNARAAAIAANVPVVPGSRGRITDVAEAIAIAEEIGYPVMVKAAAGGGGRGIRVAHSRRELEKTLPTAMSEARAGFGDDGLYIEAFIQRARHIEVQILADGQSAIHLFERECSLQRRRQKVWEEAPAVMLPAAVREELCASAVRLAEEVGYRGAGTLEYLYDMDREAFYFIEMNTRIQVEHPVTEMITGVDLLREMLLIAGGRPLTVGQEDVQCVGHAIEVRLNAENPANNFMPAPGVVETLTIPGGPGIRFDTGIYEGYGIPPYYDSLLGKLIVWDVSRERALDRLAGALGELAIGPNPTTASLHTALVGNVDVRAGDVSTNWLEAWLEEDRMTALPSGTA